MICLFKSLYLKRTNCIYCTSFSIHHNFLADLLLLICIYICTCRSEGLSSALCSIHNPPSLRPGGYRGHGTQGSPGGYRSHGTQGNQLSSRRACPSPHAAVPREAAAVEGDPLEFRTSSPLHSSGSLAHSYICVCTCRSEGLSSALCSIHNPPSLRPGGYRGHGTQGSPGGYRSHGTQGNQLSSRRACPSPHAAVPREAAAVEGDPLEFRTSSPLHSSGSLAHSLFAFGA